MNKSRNPYLYPLVLVTSLFFLWGLAYGLLDVLNNRFQESLHITKTRSTLLQGTCFGAYFLAALMAMFFFGPIIFPTIFALAVKDLGHHKKKDPPLSSCRLWGRPGPLCDGDAVRKSHRQRIHPTFRLFCRGGLVRVEGN